VARTGLPGQRRQDGAIDVARCLDGSCLGAVLPLTCEPILQDFDSPFADNLNIDARQLLENGEHELLLGHGRSIFDFVLLSEREELGR
jgi:hypothetical protein